MKHPSFVKERVPKGGMGKGDHPPVSVRARVMRALTAYPPQHQHYRRACSVHLDISTMPLDNPPALVLVKRASIPKRGLPRAPIAPPAELDRVTSIINKTNNVKKLVLPANTAVPVQ